MELIPAVVFWLKNRKTPQTDDYMVVDGMHEAIIDRNLWEATRLRRKDTGVKWNNCYMYGTPIQIRIEEEQIIISNRCILPEGWTAETLMQPHDSIPYNPDIANVFYRAGYIETWGQGIQKICDECTALGAELPKYEIIGTGLRVYFPALKSALIDQPKTPNRQGVGKDVGLEVGLAEKIIDLILEDSEIKMSEMAEKLEVTTRTIEREMKKLRESGRVIRVGGKRYGHWEVR